MRVCELREALAIAHIFETNTRAELSARVFVVPSLEWQEFVIGVTKFLRIGRWAGGFGV